MRKYDTAFDRLRVAKIDLIGISNPGGAHGFSPDKWRDATRRILMAKAWRFG